MITIDKDVPLPPRVVSSVGGRPPVIGHEARAIMDVMEVGDSFKLTGTFARNTLYVFLSREGKRLNKKFRMASETGHIRIWRAE
jgi:hypothetical protein